VTQPRPEALLWDFDGTLVDTEPAWLECQHELIGEYGGTYTHEAAMQCVGQSMEDSARIQIALTAHPDLDVDWWVQELSSRVVKVVWSRPIPWRAGARELLAECTAQGRPCALVTASPPELVAAVFDRTDLDPFAAKVFGGEVAHGKPHPEPYLTWAARLGVDPTRCLAFEDSNPGSDSANAAGAVVIACPSLASVNAAPRRVILDTLDGLTLSSAERLWRTMNDG
jgi:HAD superfamily hydrolase (TIGR01509 family)